MVSRIKRYFGMVGLVAVAALLYSVFFIAVPNVKAAPSASWTECYSLTSNWPQGGKTIPQLLSGWNAKRVPINNDGQKFADCFGLSTDDETAMSNGTYYASSLIKTPGSVPVCAAYQLSPIKSGSNIYLKCTNPTTYYNELYDPVVNVACPASEYLGYNGQPLDPTKYNNCASKTKSAYDACDVAAAIGGSTGSIQKSDSDMAACLIQKGINGTPVDLTAAVASGRATANKLASDNNTSSSQNNAAYDATSCATAGGKWDGTLCVTAAAMASQKGTSSCAVQGIGWIVCPVVNFLAGISDGAFGFLSNNFLKTDTSIVDTSSKTYTAWSVMRSIANVAFVIVFLIIIFSQLTNVGISNYGVKKMLPRLIIAAILVNLSYFICQIAVDVSNILGFSLKDLFDNVVKVTIPSNISSGSTGLGLAGVAGGILAIAGAAAIGYALLATLIPVLLAAVVALIMILFILIARQALIILLIVVSPLAFVAFLLPNTESIFKKWQKAFTAMLLLFPIIAVVFGASTLASNILSSTFSANFPGDTSASAMFGQLIGSLVLVLPLFIIPGLLKKSLDGVGSIGAKINGIGGKLGGALGAKGKEGYSQSAIARGRELKKQGKQEFRNRRFNDAMAGGDGKTQRLIRALGRGGRPFTASGKFARDRVTQAAAGASASAENKDYNDAVAAAAAQQRTYTVKEVAGMAATGMYKGQVITEHERAAAIDRTMSSGGFNERRAVLEGLASNKANISRDLRSRAITGAYAKGDQNIYGVGFGDQILADRQVDPLTGAVIAGGINSAGDLAKAAVKNAADGHTQAEHLVQGASATEYLVDSTLASTDPDAVNARIKLRAVAATKLATPTIQGRSDDVIDASLGKL